MPVPALTSGIGRCEVAAVLQALPEIGLKRRFLIGLVVDFLLVFGIIFLHTRIEKLIGELGREKP